MNQSLLHLLTTIKKAFQKKYQRFGESNKFVKVTASMFKKYSPIEHNTPNPTEKVQLTYIDQPIPFLMVCHNMN